MLDLKIVNGKIVDGTGGAAFRADIGIQKGRIVEIGTIDSPATYVLDAKGMVVAPGFIDVHTHYDAQVFWDPSLSPSCFHGVTTVLGGNCGFSIAPLTPDAGAYLMPMLARVEGMPLVTLREGVPWNWRTFGEYLSRFENTIAVNAGFMVGHSAVRRVVMGPRAITDEANADEIEQMKQMVHQSISEGALGFSTTVSVSHNDADGNPVPSRRASRQELMALASAVKDHEGTLLELLPGLSFDQSTKDLLTDFSLAGQRPVNWNVLVVNGSDPDNIERTKNQLSASNYARSKGAEVIALTPAGHMTLRMNLLSGFVFDMLPGWQDLFRLPLTERLEKLTQREFRAGLESSALTAKGPLAKMADWARFAVIETFTPQNKRFEGMTVAEVAQLQEESPFDAMIDLAIADGLKTSFMPPISGADTASYRLRAELWKDDRTVVGASDAGAHMDMIDTFAFSTQLLGNSRRRDLLPLTQAVHVLTQVPATRFGLRDRGVLSKGACADLVIFDPETVDCGPVYTRFDLPGSKTEGRLYADAIGVQHVIVNGRVIVREGKLTEERPGKVLRSGTDTYTVKIGAAA